MVAPGTGLLARVSSAGAQLARVVVGALGHRLRGHHHLLLRVLVGPGRASARPVNAVVHVRHQIRLVQGAQTAQLLLLHGQGLVLVQGLELVALLAPSPPLDLALVPLRLGAPVAVAVVVGLEGREVVHAEGRPLEAAIAREPRRRGRRDDDGLVVDLGVQGVVAPAELPPSHRGVEQGVPERAHQLSLLRAEHGVHVPIVQQKVGEPRPRIRDENLVVNHHSLVPLYGGRWRVFP